MARNCKSKSALATSTSWCCLAEKIHSVQCKSQSHIPVVNPKVCIVESIAVHIISEGVLMTSHVNNVTRAKMALMALPVQMLLAWMPRALHVPLSGDYCGACSL